MARRAVKLRSFLYQLLNEVYKSTDFRQIDAVQQEMKTYQTAAQVLDTMTANTSSKKVSLFAQFFTQSINLNT